MKIMKNDKVFVEYLMKIENKDKFNNLINKTDESFSNIPTQDNSLLNTTRKTFSNLPMTTTHDFRITTSNNFAKASNFNSTFNDKDKLKKEEPPLMTRNSFYPTITNSHFNATEKDSKQRTSFKLTLGNLSTAAVSKATSNTEVLNKSTISFNKFVARMKKPPESIKVGNLLNVDYNSLFKRKINIRNKELKSMWDEVDHYGPRFAHCNTCFNMNLDFFENINSKDGVNIINFIKSKRSTKS
jgi:hypothetical protein